ncbi:MAG: hypothetical protein WC817_01725 [Patescibacteria group bacterium]
MEQHTPQSKNRFLPTKILATLLPAAVFTQNWAWMSGNRAMGLGFIIFWALLILHVWSDTNKNKVLKDLFRATEIGFFLLPISALAIMFHVGAAAVRNTSGAAQAGAAIGTAIGGTLAVGLGFVVGLSGGIIMHLLASRYTHRMEGEPLAQPHLSKWEENITRHKTAITVAVLVVLVIVAAASSTSTNKLDSSTATTTPVVSSKPSAATIAQEPIPLEIVKSSVTKDIIGMPQANVTIKNVSDKTIDAYKLHIRMFNSFGEPASFLGDNVFNGLSQGSLIAPSKTGSDAWSLFGHDTTSKIEVEPYHVHFTDGTTWEK